MWGEGGKREGRGKREKGGKRGNGKKLCFHLSEIFLTRPSQTPKLRNY